MKLRLLLFKKCNRKCIKCCNKGWDLDTLETNNSYKGYSEILLTGGEPLLEPDLIQQIAIRIRVENKDAPIYVYTAKGDNIDDMIKVMSCVDGITFTLHEQKDVKPFIKLNDFMEKFLHLFDYLGKRKKQLRLNIFEGVDVGDIDLKLWKVKPNMKWIKNCPLPKDEVFKKLQRI